MTAKTTSADRMAAKRKRDKARGYIRFEYTGPKSIVDALRALAKKLGRK